MGLTECRIPRSQAKTTSTLRSVEMSLASADGKWAFDASGEVTQKKAEVTLRCAIDLSYISHAPAGVYRMALLQFVKRAGARRPYVPIDEERYSWRVDRSEREQNNPLFGTKWLNEGEQLSASTSDGGAGSRMSFGGGGKPASLRDTPGITFREMSDNVIRKHVVDFCTVAVLVHEDAIVSALSAVTWRVFATVGPDEVHAGVRQIEAAQSDEPWRAAAISWNAPVAVEPFRPRVQIPRQRPTRR